MMAIIPNHGSQKAKVKRQNYKAKVKRVIQQSLLPFELPLQEKGINGEEAIIAPNCGEHRKSLPDLDDSLRPQAYFG
jgi:hypothetical protein